MLLHKTRALDYLQRCDPAAVICTLPRTSPTSAITNTGATQSRVHGTTRHIFELSAENYAAEH